MIFPDINDISAAVGPGLLARGYAVVEPRDLDWNRLQDAHVLLNAARNQLGEDLTGGRKWRAHAELMRRQDGKLEIQPHRPYVQYENDLHPGIERTFKPLGEDVVGSATVTYLMELTEALGKYVNPDLPLEHELGLHVVDYRPRGTSPSYASPVSMHRDDESCVSVVLLEVSRNLGGGANGITENPRSVDHVFQLTSSFQMLVLTRKVLHAVYPMFSTDGLVASRKILIVTCDAPAGPHRRPR